MSQQPEPPATFSKLAITRLAHKAGVKTFGKPSHEEVYTAAAAFLESTLKRLLQAMEDDRRVTLLEADITTVLGAPAAEATPSIPRAPFKRLVQTLLTRLKPRTRWTLATIHQLQTHTETYLERLLEDANICASHADRETLMPKDIQLVLHLRSRV
jgi:histone H3/H4